MRKREQQRFNFVLGPEGTGTGAPWPRTVNVPALAVWSERHTVMRRCRLLWDEKGVFAFTADGRMIRSSDRTELRLFILAQGWVNELQYYAEREGFSVEIVDEPTWKRLRTLVPVDPSVIYTTLKAIAGVAKIIPAGAPDAARVLTPDTLRYQRVAERDAAERLLAGREGVVAER